MGLLTDVIIFPRDQNTDGLLLGVGGDGRGWEGCTKADAVMITITKSWPTVGSLGLGVRGVCSRGCRHKQVQYIQFHGEGVDRLMSVAVDMVCSNSTEIYDRQKPQNWPVDRDRTKR